MPTNNTARLLEIRDGIVSELNDAIATKDEAGATLAIRQFTADGKWRVSWTNEELRNLKVTVRPLLRATAVESKGWNDVSYAMEICLQESVHPTDDARFDELVNIANRVMRRFEPNHKLTATGVTEVVVDGNNPPVWTVYDPAQLDSGRFFSRIELTLEENIVRGV